MFTELNYYSIILMILIIVILLSTKKTKEGFYVPSRFSSRWGYYYPRYYHGNYPKYCSKCGNKSIRNCSNCMNCGLCTRPDGLIECVSGDKYGPYFRSDCLDYNYNAGYDLPYLYYYDYYGNPYRGRRFGGYWRYRMKRRGRKGKRNRKGKK